MMKSRVACAAAATALAGAASIGCAQAATTPATAHTATHHSAATHHTPAHVVSVPAKVLSHFTHLLHAHHSAHSGLSANQTSTNWAGYAANSGTFTTVSSSWVEPSVSCNSDGIAAFWIGLDGWGSSTVEQDGTGVDCSSGSPQPFAWWETYPANSVQEYSDPVQPGDQMSSTVTDQGGGQYEMVLTDSTEGWTEDQTYSADGSDASAEVVAEAVTSGSSVTALPDFGSVNFSGSTFNGGTLEAAGAQGIDMTDSSGNVIASTGPLDGSGDFTVSYTGN